jgi:2-hydroxy-3-keto-5-methylthiopentenyl-1-phosphate phosphatase
MGRNIIAVVYDFDGTLSPKSMQEYTVLPNLGVPEIDAFWDDVTKEARETGAENTLVWMRRIKELAQDRQLPITKEYFRKCGRDIRYFSGVEQFFSTVNAYVKKASKGRIQVRHYIVSAGLKEILEGVSIRGKFQNIFGSEYHYDEYGRPDFPKVVITDTIKTQYLFRINKGKEDLGESINEHMPEKDRPIPFQNMIYIGDGLTDVPAMTVTKKSGGHSIAVYRPGHKKGTATCQKLLDAGRVNFIAQADYCKSGALFRQVSVVLDRIINC